MMIPAFRTPSLSIFLYSFFRLVFFPGPPTLTPGSCLALLFFSIALTQEPLLTALSPTRQRAFTGAFFFLRRAFARACIFSPYCDGLRPWRTGTRAPPPFFSLRGDLLAKTFPGLTAEQTLHALLSRSNCRPQDKLPPFKLLHLMIPFGPHLASYYVVPVG